MKLRTFIALELPDRHKQAILKYLNTWSSLHRTGINWVKPENLHLTLLFLGDTEAGLIPDLKEALLRQLIRMKGFEMSCLGFELFPARQPRLLWVKLQSEDRRIFDLAKELGRTVRDCGCEPDIKPLKLHVTVGRIKIQQPAWLEQEFMQTELPKDKAFYGELTFYQSLLKPAGPVYTPLQQYDLIK